MYRYANAASSALTTAISTAVRPVSFDVADPSAFPASGDFVVIIESEFILVTTVAGSTFTGSNTEGSTAATHASASAVTQILTAAGLLGSPGPMTTAADMYYAGASVVPTRIPIGSAGNVLTVSGGIPIWAVPAAVNLTTGVTGILPTANGGTGIAYFTAAGPTAARVFTFPDAAATIARTDAGQTFTGAQVITEPVGASGLTVTGATQTSSFPALSITQTWNASGTTFTAFKLNVTNTASASASLLMDVQLGGSSILTLGRNSSLKVRAGNDICDVTSGGILWSTNAVGQMFAVTEALVSSGTAIQVGALGTFSWQSTNRVDSGTSDTVIKRAAAATVQFGFDLNGAAVSQALQAANGITGTDKTGGNFTLASGKGTGAGAVSSVFIQTPTALGSGTTAQSLTTRVTVDVNGIKATGYLSSDGSAGVTAGPFTTITSITVKNGLITALTGA